MVPGFGAVGVPNNLKIFILAGGIGAAEEGRLALRTRMSSQLRMRRAVRAKGDEDDGCEG